MLERKKGIALNQAFGAVLTLVLVAVLVIIAIVLFVNLGATFTNLDTYAADNETLTAVTEVAQFVAQSPTENTTLCNYADFSVVATNATGGEIILVANYTASASAGSILSAADGNYNNTDWNLTYSGNWGGQSCVATDNMIVQFATYPILIGLVGTIIFLGLVIGVLVASFVFGRRSGI